MVLYYDDIIDIKRSTNVKDSLYHFASSEKSDPTDNALATCLRHCTYLQLAKIELVNDITVYGSFNNLLNQGLYEGNGLADILKYFNIQLDEIDLIVLNKGNPLSFAVQAFKKVSNYDEIIGISTSFTMMLRLLAI